MVESPLTVIFEMVFTILQNTISTLFSLLGMMGSLTQSLGFISSTGGLGFVLSVIILVAVLFFLTKFFFKSGKMILILFIIGIVLLFALFYAI